MNNNNYTIENVMDRMLINIPDEYDKRETSLIYQSMAMVVPEIISLNFDIDSLQDEAFPDTCSMDSLIKYAKQKGIDPRPATVGTVIAEFNREVDIGARFYCEGKNYKVTAKIEDFKYRLISENPGHIDTIGDLIPLEDINRLEKAKILEVEHDGKDEEDVESLRKRYFNAIESQAFGGNRADYLDKIMRLDNVGGAKVFRRTPTSPISIMIIDTLYNPASDEMINSIKNYLDPSGSGDGTGSVPFGHIVDVQAPNFDVININLTVSYEAGVEVTIINEDIKSSIESYINELKTTWAESSFTTIRISHIENKALNVEGVLDVYDTKINNIAKNYNVQNDKLPKIGVVNIVKG